MLAKRSPLTQIAIFFFLGIVAVVWVVNFAMGIIRPEYNAAPVNQFVMALFGSGALLQAIMSKIASDGGGTTE